VFWVSASIYHRFVELNAEPRGYLLVCPAVIEEQLSAMFGEGSKIRIQFVNVFVNGVRFEGVAFEIEASPVPVKIQLGF